MGAPVRIADMQPGMRAVRMPDGSLNRVTGSAGNDIYRGDRLPPGLLGDYIYGEPIGRVVRRVKPVVAEGLTQLRNAYRWNEFIKSTDPLFRPVDMATAPDGTLYIAELSKVSKIEKVEDVIDNPPKPTVIFDKLPKDEAHGWKFIGIGPDARSGAFFQVTEAPDVWHVRQVIDDPAGDHEWAIQVDVDLPASDELGAPVVRPTAVARL